MVAMNTTVLLLCLFVALLLAACLLTETAAVLLSGTTCCRSRRSQAIRGKHAEQLRCGRPTGNYQASQQLPPRSAILHFRVYRSEHCRTSFCSNRLVPTALGITVKAQVASICEPFKWLVTAGGHVKLYLRGYHRYTLPYTPKSTTCQHCSLPSYNESTSLKLQHGFLPLTPGSLLRGIQRHRRPRAQPRRG